MENQYEMVGKEVLALEFVSLFDFRQDTIEGIESMGVETSLLLELVEKLDFNQIIDVLVAHLSEQYATDELKGLIELYIRFPELHQKRLMQVVSEEIQSQMNGLDIE